MGRSRILYSFVLLGVICAPLVEKRVSAHDGPDLDASEVPALFECESFEPTLLSAFDAYSQAVSLKADRPGGVLSVLDDRRFLNSIRTYLRALNTVRDCRRSLYDRTPSPVARKMIVIPRCELPGGGVIEVAPDLQLGFGAMATERIVSTYESMRAETWDIQPTFAGTTTYSHMVPGVGVCELSSTGHVSLLSAGKLLATYSSGMWEIKDVSCKLGKYAGSSRTFQFQGSRAVAPGATEFGHDAGLLVLDTPTKNLQRSPPYWERYQLTKRKVRIGDAATGFALKLNVELDAGAHHVNFHWANGNDIVLDWQRGALVSSNFLPRAYYGDTCETKVVCRDGSSNCAYDRERFIPALDPLPPSAQARLEQ